MNQHGYCLYRQHHFNINQLASKVAGVSDINDDMMRKRFSFKINSQMKSFGNKYQIIKPHARRAAGRGYS